jgi:hypothetical protein
LPYYSAALSSSATSPRRRWPPIIGLLNKRAAASRVYSSNVYCLGLWKMDVISASSARFSGDCIVYSKEGYLNPPHTFRLGKWELVPRIRLILSVVASGNITFLLIPTGG